MRALRVWAAGSFLALLSCATMNKSTFSDSQNECLRNVGQCSDNCSSWFRGKAPTSNDYSCEALAMANASKMLSGTWGPAAGNPDVVRFHIAAMDNLCRDGVESGCSVRDSLQGLLGRLVASRDQMQSDDARTKTIQAKLADAEHQAAAFPYGTGVPGYPEHFAASQSALGKHDLDTADQQADLTLQDVKNLIAARQSAADALAAKQAQVEAEKAGIQAARDACTTSPSTCKAKCDAGNDPNFCVAWAWKLRDQKPPPLADERTYVKKACDAGNQTACGIVPMIDKDIEAVAAKAEELWGDVQGAGDEIARDLGQASFARSKESLMPASHQRQTERAIQRMTVERQAIVDEKYCPAKKSFLKEVSGAEFTKRAAAHCKDNPPTGMVGDPLTAQCRTAFASSCP